MSVRPGPIRVLPIPAHQPPALPPGRREPAGLRPMFVQDALALDFRAEREFATECVPTSLPEPATWVRGVAQALIEVMAGIRPPASVVRLTTPQVYVAVARRYGVTVRRAARSTTEASGFGPALAGRDGRRRLAVLRVRCARNRADCAEVAVVLSDGPRVRAMALELTAVSGGWRVSALQIA